MMMRWTRSLSVTGAVVGALAICAPAVSAAGQARKDSGTSYVAITHDTAKYSYTAGNNTDKILGTGAVTYVLQLLKSADPAVYTVSLKQIILYTRTGSLSGTATAILTVGANGSATVTNGKLRLTKGAGSQAGHSLIATFHGTGAIASRTFKFIYSGTYK